MQPTNIHYYYYDDEYNGGGKMITIQQVQMCITYK